MSRRLKLFFGILISLVAVPAIACANPASAAVVAWATSTAFNAAVATFVGNTAISVASPPQRGI